MELDVFMVTGVEAIEVMAVTAELILKAPDTWLLV